MGQFRDIVDKIETVPSHHGASVLGKPMSQTNKNKWRISESIIILEISVISMHITIQNWPDRFLILAKVSLKAHKLIFKVSINKRPREK